MFSSDSDRVIPRQRIKFGNIIIQFSLLVFVILFFRQIIFDSNATDWLAENLVILFVAFFVLTSLIGSANR